MRDIEYSSVLYKPRMERGEGATLTMLIARYCTATALDQFGLTMTEMERKYKINVLECIACERLSITQECVEEGIFAVAKRYGVPMREFAQVYGLRIEEYPVPPQRKKIKTSITGSEQSTIQLPEVVSPIYLPRTTAVRRRKNSAVPHAT